MNSHKPISGILLVTILLLSSACRNVEESHNPVSDSLVGVGATPAVEIGNTSEELGRIQFDDVPSPPGFFFRNHRNESYSFVDGSVRLGRFVYSGKSDSHDVLAHYKNVMPKSPYGWSRSEDTVSSGPNALLFEKNGEKCVIETKNIHHGVFRETLVTVTVRRQLRNDDKISNSRSSR